MIIIILIKIVLAFFLIQCGVMTFFEIKPEEKTIPPPHYSYVLKRNQDNLELRISLVTSLVLFIPACWLIYSIFHQ